MPGFLPIGYNTSSMQPFPHRARTLNLTLGLAASRDMASDIAIDARVANVPLAIGELEKFAASVDIVLIVAEQDLDPEIASLLFGPDPEFRTALHRACKGARVPIVLWRLDDSVSLRDCVQFASICSAIFAARPELSNARFPAQILPVAVQVARYNPYQSIHAYLEPASCTEVGYFGSQLEEFAVPPLNLKNAVSSDPDARAQFLRASLAAVIDCRRYPVTKLEGLVLQAVASGTLPVLFGEPKLSAETSAICSFAKTPAAVAGLIDAFRGNPLNARKRAHIGWRAAFRDHALTFRLDHIARAVNLSSGWEQYPPVTVFVPTFRAEYIGRCLENYRKQTYTNRELILALHSDAPPRSEIDAIRARNSDVRIVCMPREETVGGLMNLAIHHASGTYCVKMDDDDYYGENYVMDMILAQRAVDLDIFGKPPAFTYFEASDQTCLRKSVSGKENCIVDAKSLISKDFRITGSTHSGKTEFLRSVMFCDRARGSADTALYERCEKREVVGATLDAFNTAAFRAADPGKHTWRQADKQLLQGAISVGRAYQSEAVEI